MPESQREKEKGKYCLLIESVFRYEGILRTSSNLLEVRTLLRWAHTPSQKVQVILSYVTNTINITVPYVT
jgi:hypothetical protein